ncbi:pirin family protein [Streptacidiphilus griseoplanus]|uniref:pirin family protein n=1 Tax=Peterkaempfera griseoplana TaxID=66896 RepID=UPI0007C72D75|nr:pirin family protein [Peterkaempfera griseoplana]
MTDQSRPRAEVRRAAERYRSAPAEGVETRHAFSFSGHYDPRNTHFGSLLACNEELLAPGAGFEQHRHRDVEIVTWVVEGALAHRDDRGHAGVVRPGMVQYLGAGSGVAHTERNLGGAAEPVRFVQMWLQPDRFDAEPVYGLARPAPDDRGVALLASGMERDADRGALRLRRRDAALHHVTAGPWQPLPPLPDAPFRHLHLLRGSLGFRTGAGPHGTGRDLRPGDSARITGKALVAPTAGEDGAELLLWEMHSPLLLG